MGEARLVFKPAFEVDEPRPDTDPADRVIARVVCPDGDEALPICCKALVGHG
jgi:hypothetical protein